MGAFVDQIRRFGPMACAFSTKQNTTAAAAVATTTFTLFNWPSFHKLLQITRQQHFLQAEILLLEQCRDNTERHQIK